AYRHYAHQFPQPLDAALEAHYQLDQLYAAAGEENKRQFWLNKIIVLHNKAGAEQTDRSRYLAASAAFQLGEAERLRYEKIRSWRIAITHTSFRNHWTQRWKPITSSISSMLRLVKRTSANSG